MGGGRRVGYRDTHAMTVDSERRKYCATSRAVHKHSLKLAPVSGLCCELPGMITAPTSVEPMIWGGLAVAIATTTFAQFQAQALMALLAIVPAAGFSAFYAPSLHCPSRTRIRITSRPFLCALSAPKDRLGHALPAGPMRHHHIS